MVVRDQDPAAALEGARLLRARLQEEGLVTPPAVQGARFAAELARALPYRFTARDEEDALKLITPPAVAAKMRGNFENLVSFQGSFMKELIRLDPLGFVALSARKLKGFDVASSFTYSDGFLTSPDGQSVVGMYNAAFDPGDFASARRMDAAFARAAALLPASSRAFYLGSARYTNENVALVRHDLKLIGALAALCMGALFFGFFRRARALLIFLLPVFVLAPAALVTYWVFGGISGVTLGFGSVVAGLAVDYSVYVYFALCGGRKTPQETVRALAPHLLYGYATSAACFAALFASSITLFKQIAVFSIAGLTVALLLALFVFPLFWRGMPPAPALGFWRLPNLSKKTAVWLLCLLAVGGVTGAARMPVSGDLEELNSTSAGFRSEKAAFDKLFAQTAGNTGLLFVFGRTQEEALQHNEEVSRALGRPLAVSEVFPSRSAREANLARWNAFWNRHDAQTRALVEQNALLWGLKPAAFTPFADWISLPPGEDTFDFSSFYSPLARVRGGYAAVNMVPAEDPFIDPAVPGIRTVFVSAAALKRDLAAGVRAEAVKIILAALLFSGGLVYWFFKDWRRTLLAFVPVAGAFSLTFLVFWLCGIRVNLFVLVFLPLLTGLGVDYGLFQLVKTRAGADSSFYPSRALAAAALSTLAGFGTLALADHAVLFIIGLSCCLGIGGAALSALFLLPPLLEDK